MRILVWWAHGLDLVWVVLRNGEISGCLTDLSSTTQCKRHIYKPMFKINSFVPNLQLLKGLLSKKKIIPMMLMLSVTMLLIRDLQKLCCPRRIITAYLDTKYDSFFGERGLSLLYSGKRHRCCSGALDSSERTSQKKQFQNLLEYNPKDSNISISPESSQNI